MADRWYYLSRTKRWPKGPVTTKVDRHYTDGKGYHDVKIVARVRNTVVGELSAFVPHTDNRRDARALNVNDIMVGPKRQGVATKLYEVAARFACDEIGVPLASDQHRTAASDTFWKKQVRKRRAVCARKLEPFEQKSARERVKRFSEDRPLYGRSGCDRYVMKACPAPASLARARRTRR